MNHSFLITRSLSVGARQTVGFTGAVSSSLPAWTIEMISPFALSTRYTVSAAGAVTVKYSSDVSSTTASAGSALAVFTSDADSSLSLIHISASSGDADLVSAIVSGVHGIITDDCAKLDKCLTAYFGAGTLTRVTGVTGHRGVPSLEHQNTVKSSLRAYELGATMIENDLHLSRDGVIMVMHLSLIHI